MGLKIQYVSLSQDHGRHRQVAVRGLGLRVQRQWQRRRRRQRSGPGEQQHAAPLPEAPPAHPEAAVLLPPHQDQQGARGRRTAGPRHGELTGKAADQTILILHLTRSLQEREGEQGTSNSFAPLGAQHIIPILASRVCTKSTHYVIFLFSDNFHPFHLYSNL